MKNGLHLLILVFTLQSCENQAQEKSQSQNNRVETQEKIQAQKIKQKTKIPIPNDEIVEEFYQAIADKNNNKVQQMLETKFPPNYEPKNKIPPLQAVIWSSDNVYLTKLFVEGGAKINDGEKSYLLIAAEYGRLEILKYLVEKGDDIQNSEAFNVAGFYQFYDGAKFLLFSDANQEKGDIRGKLWVFEQAVIKSDYEVLNKLVLTNDDLNSNNCNGETALIIAVKKNNIEMVKYLLSRNVDKQKPETFDCGDDINYGRTPLQIARKNKFQEIISLLK